MKLIYNTIITKLGSMNILELQLLAYELQLLAYELQLLAYVGMVIRSLHTKTLPDTINMSECLMYYYDYYYYYVIP